MSCSVIILHFKAHDANYYGSGVHRWMKFDKTSAVLDEKRYFVK